MKVEKRTDGSYRIRKMVDGKMHTFHFDHEPTDRDVYKVLEHIIWAKERDKCTMETYINKYIDSKRNVLSPSSILTYERLIKAMSTEFLNIPLFEITQFDVQEEINRYSESHAPKTVKSLHGFIASVIGLFRPEMTLRTTLPQKIEKEKYTPTEDDIKAILDHARGTEDYIAFRLGTMGLRRSEVVALQMEDLTGNELHIHANMVYNKKWIRKESPKTDAGNRTIYLPDDLIEDINKQGYFFKYSANKLSEHLHRHQKELGIPQFRFHDLRHFFASYASNLMSESDAMALGGWKSSYVFEKIYRESLEKQRKASAELFNQKLFMDKSEG